MRFGFDRSREGLSYKRIEKELHGNCKAIAELYVNILNDNRVGIKSELVTINKTPGTHVDAILHINGKQYMTNLIGDLTKIKTARRIKCFCFDLERNKNIMYNPIYKQNIQKYYKNFSFLTREEIEGLDKKLGYSYIPESEQVNEKRGIYTEDVFDRIKKELSDPSNFEKYVLKNKKDVKDEEILKYKLQFFFENMDRFSTYNGEMRYLENIRYYFYTLRGFFTTDEAKRLKLYACIKNHDFSHVYSIIKLKPQDKENGQNTYFFYNDEEKKYKEISKEELKQWINRDKSFQIVGEIDQINYMKKDELEL